MAAQSGAFMVDDPEIVKAFLEYLPQRLKNYERGCIPSEIKVSFPTTSISSVLN
jgi:hypothetical protein